MSKLHITNDPGGWQVNNYDIGSWAWSGLADQDGEVKAFAVAWDANINADPSTKEHAERLVACWNFCEGISTKNLRENIPLRELLERYNRLVKRVGGHQP